MRWHWATKALFAFSFFCVASAPLRADQIAIDTSVSIGFFGAASKTQAFTVGTGSNRLIVVGCGLDIPTSEGATYNGVVLTTAVFQNSVEHSVIWYGTNPASGNHNIVITLGSSVNAVCAAISFTGVDQNNPINATNKGDVTSTNPTTSVTVLATTLGNQWILDMIFENGTTITAPTTVNTQVASVFNAGGPSAGAMSVKGPVNAGSNSLAWTSASADWAKTIIAINPAFPKTGNIQVLPGTGQIGVLPGAGTIGVIHP